MTRALTLFFALALFGLVLLTLSVPIARAAGPTIVRVTPSGTAVWPCGDQTNWSNPCALQTALSNALSGSELWVAAGIYTPTTTDVDPRAATFQLRDDIALYGGFAGGETLRSQRDLSVNAAILSGDIGTPNVASDNLYHVVTSSLVTNTAVLDGFIVMGGRADATSGYFSLGGGMYNYQGSPTLANVAFISNSAVDGGGMYSIGGNPTLRNVAFSNNSALDGGGMFNGDGSNPALMNVIFSGNSATTEGGGMTNYGGSPMLTNTTFISNTAGCSGGGMSNDGSATLTNVTFSGNSVGVPSCSSSNSFGGGMDTSYSSPMLINVTFSANSATWGGGGMHNDSGSPTLMSVTFISNSALYGGGMRNDCGARTCVSSPKVTDVTFSNNTANDGGGMYNSFSSPTLINVTLSGNSASNIGGAMYNLDGSLTITNTIFWSNSAPDGPQIYNDSVWKISQIDYSVVQGGCPAGSTCSNIITGDPRLGPLGYWGGSTQTIPLLPGSSAIDAGNDTTCPPTDQRGVPRPQGAHCDIGAFEGQLMLLNFPLIRR